MSISEGGSGTACAGKGTRTPSRGWCRGYRGCDAEDAKLLHQVGDGRVAFFHELIQEYFAAKELSGTTEVRRGQT